jgi:hypothetical protein
MSQFKQYIILVFLAVTFGYAANAQGLSLTPIEGSIHDYTCNGITEGSSYTFNVVATNGAQTGGYDFIGVNSGIIGNDGLASAQIQWNTGSSLNKYEVWLEVSASGCSNKIFLGVSPQPNNRSIGFDVVASTECFNVSDNNFTVSFITEDNNGQPIPAAYFPLSVQFTVNGTIQSQLLEFDNQVLQVNETMFAANPAQNTVVEVAIVSVTDLKNAPVQPGAANGTHIHTIFAIPEIEFTEELLKKYYSKHEEITAFTNNNARRMERMEPK